MTCLWNITVDPGYVIRLSTINQYLSLTCNYEYVKVFDGSTVNGPILGTLCSGQNIGPVYSTGNNILVKLVTGSLSRGKGIFMTYKAVKYQKSKYRCTASIVRNKIVNDPNAKIASPWYPDWYPNNIYCIWYVFAPFGYLARMTIQQLELQDSKDCKADKLEISEAEYSTPSRTLCGKRTSPLNITASGQVLVVKFSSDWSGQRPGFEAVFNTVKDGK